jgi:hypothetical protein
VAGGEVIGTDARVLFVDDQGEHQLSAEIGLGQRCRGCHGGGDATLHIVATPAEQAPAFQPRLERRDRHTGGADRIDVCAEDQGRAVAIADLSRYVGPARRDLLEPGAHASAHQPVASELGDGDFAFRLVGSESRVDRWDADQLLEQLEQDVFGDGIGSHRVLLLVGAAASVGVAAPRPTRIDGGPDLPDYSE